MIRKLTFVAAVCCITLALTSCERKMISDITADPSQYSGKEVSVAGRVTNVSMGALGIGFYQIDDGTGRLYIISETRGAPTEGAYVGVKGKVLPTFTFMGKNYATVLYESGRRSVRPTD